MSDILLESGTNELEIVEFVIESADGKKSGYYGINVAKVLEIIRSPKITSLTSSSRDYLLGVFELRGRVIPILDLRRYIAGEFCREGAKTIVAEFNQMQMGFLVSGVTRIHRLSWQDVESPGQVVQTAESCITGMIKFEDRITQLIDVEKIAAEVDPEQTAAEHALNQGPFRGARVLIADDSLVVRNMLQSTLESAGFKVTATSHGQEAWELLAAFATREELCLAYQLVVTDIEMPVLDGLTLTRKIKEHDVCQALPVILYSSMISDKLSHKGASVGADAQITKPQLSSLNETALRLIQEYNTFSEP
jgi:two-component system chemotaxis response regulator CheV